MSLAPEMSTQAKAVFTLHAGSPAAAYGVFSVLLFVVAVMFFIFVIRRNGDELFEEKIKPVDMFWSIAKMLLILLVIYGLFHG